jgi:hypothetical protein
MFLIVEVAQFLIYEQPCKVSSGKGLLHEKLDIPFWLSKVTYPSTLHMKHQMIREGFQQVQRAKII